MVRETARDAAELKASLQFTHNEVDNINKSLHDKSDVLDDVVKRIEVVAPVQQAKANAETWVDTKAAMRISLISA